jgi:hypothetical protein
LALLAACVLVTACTSEPKRSLPSPPPTSAPQTSSRPPTVKPSPTPSVLADVALRKYCHAGDPLLGVYSPTRLSVKSPCASVTGVIRSSRKESDGDTHLGLAGVDARWLNPGNLARAQGDLVLEIVPDIPVAAPPVGSRVTVVGPWVLDTQTGWNEIHPVWHIVTNG